MNINRSLLTQIIMWLVAIGAALLLAHLAPPSDGIPGPQALPWLNTP